MLAGDWWPVSPTRQKSIKTKAQICVFVCMCVHLYMKASRIVRILNSCLIHDKRNKSILSLIGLTAVFRTSKSHFLELKWLTALTPSLPVWQPIRTSSMQWTKTQGADQQCVCMEPFLKFALIFASKLVSRTWRSYNSSEVRRSAEWISRWTACERARPKQDQSPPRRKAAVRIDPAKG